MNRRPTIPKYTILGILLSIVFIYLAFRKVDIKALGTKLETADLTYILLAFLPLSVCYVIKTFLWQLIIGTFKNVDFSSAFSSLMIGYFGNNVLPGRAGEFMRAYVLGRKENIGKTFLLGTIVIERLLDVLTLLMLLLLPALIFPMPKWAEHIAFTTSIVLFVVLAVAYLVLLKQNLILEKLESKLFLLSNSKRQFLITRLDSFIAGLRILKQPRLILTGFILSSLVWLLASVSMLLAFKSMDIHVPSYGSFFVLSVINLGLILPSSPGYIGTYQFLCVVALSTFSVDKETALSFSLIHHALWYVPLTVTGLIFFWRENLSLAKLKTIKEAAQ